MNCHDVQANDLIAEWSRVTESVGEIRKLLDEAIDAGSESCVDEVTFCHNKVAERVTHLATQLRLIFANEESHGFIADLYQTAPQLSDGIAQLKDERMDLLERLHEIADLVLRPEASWNDIELRFQRFVTQLSHHERSEDLLIQRASLDDSGVID